MLNTALQSVDAVARPLIATGTDYPAGTLLDTHTHRRAQLLYGMTGLMEVETDDGAWVVPPFSGVWIPAGHRHKVRMQGVSTRSVYIEPDAAPRAATGCEVLSISPLLHQLLLASAGIAALYDENGRDGAVVQLILHELRTAPTLPLFAPVARDASLAALCRAFLRQPDIRSAPQAWARDTHRSLRTFARFFRQQTGLSFGEWRRQACLLAALSRLSAGQSVTQVALELGYDSPGAFSTMFRKALGKSPSDFIRASAAPGAD